MVILVTSDLHGNLPVIDKEFDLLLICGDVCPAHDHYMAFQTEWIRNEFKDWILSLPYKDVDSKVVMVWGNHDFVGRNYKRIENIPSFSEFNNRLIILNNEEKEICGLRIFGTPYCSIFGNWAFMVENETLNAKYSNINEGLDILISHDSPTINGLGSITEGAYKNYTTGNRVLDLHIMKNKPKMFFSGHFHSGNHKVEKIEDIWMANVSIVNERYNPVNPILCVDYDPESELNANNFTYLPCDF